MSIIKQLFGVKSLTVALKFFSEVKHCCLVGITNIEIIGRTIRKQAFEKFCDLDQCSVLKTSHVSNEYYVL